MIKLNEFSSLSEGKTKSGIISTDCSKTFKGIKIPQKDKIV